VLNDKISIYKALQKKYLFEQKSIEEPPKRHRRSSLVVPDELSKRVKHTKQISRKKKTGLKSNLRRNSTKIRNELFGSSKSFTDNSHKDEKVKETAEYQPSDIISEQDTEMSPHNKTKKKGLKLPDLKLKTGKRDDRNKGKFKEYSSNVSGVLYLLKEISSGVKRRLDDKKSKIFSKTNQNSRTSLNNDDENIRSLSPQGNHKNIENISISPSLTRLSKPRYVTPIIPPNKSTNNKNDRNRLPMIKSTENNSHSQTKKKNINKELLLLSLN